MRNRLLGQLIDFGDLPVFPEATAYPAIFITQNEHRDERPTAYAPIKSLKFDSLSKAVEDAAVDLPASAFAGESWSLASATEEKLLVKMRACSVPLGDFLSTKIQYGVKTGFNKAFFIDQTTRDRLVAKDPNSAEIIKPLLVGEDIGRYEIKSKNRYLIWTYIGIQIKQYPAVFKYLTQFQKQLEKRCDKGKHWWELRACDYYDALAQPKIVFPDIAATCRFALDREGRFLGNTGYFIRGDDLFLLALLNSAAVLTWYKSQLAVYRGGYLRFFDQDVKKIPIRRINFTTPEKERQELFAQAKALYDKQVSAKAWNSEKLLDFVDQLLPLDEQGDFRAFTKSISVKEAVDKGYMKDRPAYLEDIAPSGYDAQGRPIEKSDVVHDLLAYLAEQMVIRNKVKQEIVGNFLRWLEDEIIHHPVEKLKHKAKIKEFYRLEFTEFLKILKANKCVPDPTPPKLRQAIENAFNDALTALSPELRTLEITDQLIDEIVARLYGLPGDTKRGQTSATSDSSDLSEREK